MHAEAEHKEIDVHDAAQWRTVEVKGCGDVDVYVDSTNPKVDCKMYSYRDSNIPNEVERAVIDQEICIRMEIGI